MLTLLVLLLVLPLVLPLVLTLSVQGMGGGDMFAGMEAMLGVSSSFSSMSFSSSSTTMRGGGGVSERTETTIENGKRVTKRIKTNADGSTEAVIEESEGGRTRRRSGTRQAGQELGGGE